MGIESIVKLPAIRLHFAALSNEIELINRTSEEVSIGNQH